MGSETMTQDVSTSSSPLKKSGISAPPVRATAGGDRARRTCDADRKASERQHSLFRRVNGPRVPSTLRPTVQIVLGFIFLSLALVLAAQRRTSPNPVLAIRAGGLSDLLHEMPIGRQSLVSSLYVMPLPSLMALPFTPLLRPEAYGYAYLYGLALLMAFSSAALASLLRRLRVPWPSFVGLVALILSAYALGGSVYSDLLACTAAVILALYFECAARPVLKALAGVFWGLALIAHPIGILIVALWILVVLLRRAFARRDTERNAIRWIQTVSVLYTVGVYLFLNWMIMSDSFYSVRAFRPNKSVARIGERADALSRHFRDEYGSYVPVVSGHWGYLVRPFLREYQGYHFMDFHPDKLPPWEERTPLLIVPAQENPCAAICDIGDRFSSGARWSRDYLLLESDDEWRFYVARFPRTRAPANVSGESAL